MRGMVLEAAQPRPARGAGRRGLAALRRDRALLEVLAWPVDLHRALAGDAAALRDHPQAHDLRAERWASSPRRPPACPSRSAVSATGTTATPGSGTPPSRSTPCLGSDSPRRPPDWALAGATGSASRSAAKAARSTSCTAIDGSSDLTEEIPRALGGLPGLQPGADRQRCGRPAAARHLRRGDRQHLLRRPSTDLQPATRAGVDRLRHLELARRQLGPARRRASGRPAAAGRTSPTAG